MRRTKQFHHLMLSSIVIVVCIAMGTHAQQRDPNQPRPTPTPRPITKVPGNVLTRGRSDTGITEVPGVYGTIRWSKEMGLPYDSSRVRPPYPICYLFRVKLRVQDGPAGNFGSTRTVASAVADGSPTEVDGYNTCTYRLADNGSIPRNQPLVITSEFDFRHPEAANQNWVLGSNTTPPPGQQRVIIIIGGRSNNAIKLTENERRANVDFEMVYRPIPPPPR